MRSILTALQEGRLFELPESNKDRALEFLARVLDANPEIVVGTDAIEEIKRREEECNTGIGLGVAVPHVRTKREDGELFCAIGWSPQGIEYGAQDGNHVHLVLMYYIPAGRKSSYLKEISGLVKAVKRTGGIEPIAHADNLFVVRNLLLDWVSEMSDESGPDAVARMIQLEARRAQASPLLPIPATPDLERLTVSATSPPAIFSVLITPPNITLVLSADEAWGMTMEREDNIGQRLGSGEPFVVKGRRVFVTQQTHYPRGRVLYTCVSVALGQG